MPREQDDLLMGRRIVEPNTAGTGDREPSAIWRIHDFKYRTFTEARFCTFG